MEAQTTTEPAAEPVSRRRNSALWTGTMLAIFGLASNFLYFLNPPGQAVIPWISLVLPPLGLVFLVLGVWRAFSQPQVLRGKVPGLIITAVATLLWGLSVFGFVIGRKVPEPTSAPAIGQRAPEFALPDTHGENVTLAQLLRSPDSTTGTTPKGVLLVFYRGYW
ncbi:MAG: hypothetical protein JO041_11030 [Acidobacteria bacterium]|nr:hypothetical protein [Acidobacteriota bacterium]